MDVYVDVIVQPKNESPVIVCSPSSFFTLLCGTQNKKCTLIACNIMEDNKEGRESIIKVVDVTHVVYWRYLCVWVNQSSQ